MSAVSAEFSHGSADPEARSDEPAGATGKHVGETGQDPGGAVRRIAAFGPNEWLVDELYKRYQADPGSVDKAWWKFFADYRPAPAAAAPPTQAQAGERQASGQATATPAAAPPGQVQATPPAGAWQTGVPVPAPVASQAQVP